MQKSLQAGVLSGLPRTLPWTWGENCSRVKTAKEQAFTVSGRKPEDDMWGSKMGQRKVPQARQKTANDWINKQGGAGGREGEEMGSVLSEMLEGRNSRNP